MKMLYLKRAGDENILRSYYQKMTKESSSELVERFNNVEKLYGSHQQLLFVIALDAAFRKRFDKSPVTFEDGFYGGVERTIVLEGESWEFFVSSN